VTVVRAILRPKQAVVCDGGGCSSTIYPVLIYLDSDGIRFGYLLPDTTCTDRVMSASTKEIE